MAPDLRRRVDLARAAREAREGEMKRQVDAQVRLRLSSLSLLFPPRVGVKARGVNTNDDADSPRASCAYYRSLRTMRQTTPNRSGPSRLRGSEAAARGAEGGGCGILAGELR